MIPSAQSKLTPVQNHEASTIIDRQLEKQFPVPTGAGTFFNTHPGGASPVTELTLRSLANEYYTYGPKGVQGDYAPAANAAINQLRDQKYLNLNQSRRLSPTGDSTILKNKYDKAGNVMSNSDARFRVDLFDPKTGKVLTEAPTIHMSSMAGTMARAGEATGPAPPAGTTPAPRMVSGLSPPGQAIATGMPAAPIPIAAPAAPAAPAPAAPVPAAPVPAAPVPAAPVPAAPVPAAVPAAPARAAAAPVAPAPTDFMSKLGAIFHGQTPSLGMTPSSRPPPGAIERAPPNAMPGQTGTDPATGQKFQVGPDGWYYPMPAGPPT
jgi:hypothetical protein